MNWYQYIACFFAGVLLANAVPHFVYGICGDRFPTPFAKPPGKGLSSPTVNAVWGLANFIAGFLLFRAGKVLVSNVSLTTFFVGVAVITIMSSRHFAHKNPN